MMLPFLVGCAGPLADAWPADGTYFPWVYTAEMDLEPYEEVRWETEDWDPLEDAAKSALYLQKSFNYRPGAPVETLDHFKKMRDEMPPLGSGTTVSFVGDIMWMGSNWASFAVPAAAMLDGDIRVGNVETPVDASQPTTPSELGLYRFNAPPEMLDGLPVDIVQLNNNHTEDVGDSGVDATVSEVDARGYLRTGVDGFAGMDDVAILSYTWGINRRDVTPTHELFVIPFGHLDSSIAGSRVADDVSAARSAGLKSVVVLVHWGYEYEFYPDPHFLVLGRELIAAGADLVVGEGPHVVQPAEICAVNDPTVIPGVGTCSIRTDDGKPRTAAILYSLGDFGTTLQGPPLSVGLVATVSLDPDVTGLGWAAAATVDGENGPEVRPLTELDDPELTAEGERLAAHLGAGWRR